MEHLLRYTANQPLHYQYYYRGYYYMNIRHQPERAAPMFREAAALAPPGQMAPEGINLPQPLPAHARLHPGRYGPIGRGERSLRRSLSADELPIFSQKGPDFHYRWILTHMRLGEKHYDNGEVGIADGL